MGIIPPYATVGCRIREVREQKELSQTKFAKKIGISQRLQSDLETGIQRPRLPILIAIEHEYGINRYWILQGDPPKYLDELVGYRVLPGPAKGLLNNVAEILNSGDKDLVNALTGNIKVFLGAARDRKGKGRKYARFYLNIPVEFKIIDAPGTQSGIVINGSQVGLCIESSHEMEIGKRISIEISFAKDTGPEVFGATGEILWKNKRRLDDAEGYQYGVKLNDLPKEAHAKLESLIHGYHREQVE